jgi:N-acyl-D-aspartate/D-glutamate deacylase
MILKITSKMKSKMVHRFSLLIVLLGCLTLSAQNNKLIKEKTQLITHVQLIDGTGKPAVDAAVRIQGNKIIQIGTLLPQKEEMVIDGHGWVLAPGFIDSHSHHFGDLDNHPEALPTNNQGITTIIIGQDGESYPMDTIAKMMKVQPIAINVGTYTGQSSLREEVMGEKNVYRQASQLEIDRMKIILKNELKKGSFGLSTGLEYEQAFFSSKDEVIQLAKVAASEKTSYMSHIRSEDIRMPDAIDEIIEIGRVTKMPVQISHIKLGKKDDWGTAQLLINKLEKARAAGINITADVYPYTYWNSTLRVLFPTRDYTNPVSAEFAVNQIIDVNESYLVKYAPVEAYRGKTIAAIAAMRNEKPSTTLMALIAIASDFKEKNPEFKGTIDAIAGKSMIESDVAAFIAWPNANICSDGNNTGGHPRGQGAFARVLGKYVREDKVIPLETAIYKMTGLTAQHLGMKNRGVIAVGNYADLVLFNPATVKDNATIQNSRALSTGIEMVWINGEVTYKNQKTTGAYPGVFLKR